MPEPKRLLLLRHAKSSWDDPTLADHDRPLAERGRRAAKLIGAHLREDNVPISLVLCSSARRTRETVDLVAPHAEIQIEAELYGASADQLLDQVRHVPDEAQAVMLVGHNPAIHALAVRLTQGPSELEERKFPTGALATLSFTGRWRELAPEQARLVTFVTPKALARARREASDPASGEPAA